MGSDEWTRVECPICNQVAGEFEPFGLKPRLNARCPTCGSLERHRLIWLYLVNETDLFSSRPKRMLHFAPEPALRGKFADHLSIDYVTADLAPGNAMLEMDIADIQLPDESFDVVYCSHVLEHVPDDRKAMRELLRVLRPGGWAILQVPMFGEETDEDPAVTDPAERLARFGQQDHLRAYGRDYPQRLSDAGFVVTVDRYPARLGQDLIARFRLTREDVHYCRKPLAGGTGGFVERVPVRVSAPGPRRQP